MHCAELDQVERPPAATGAPVDEQDGAARVEGDRERDDRHQWGGEQQANRRGYEARRAPQGELQARLAEGAREDQERRGERLDGELAGEVFVRAQAVLDQNTAAAALEELRQ